jgi:hypothetical protein
VRNHSSEAVEHWRISAAERAQGLDVGGHSPLVTASPRLGETALPPVNSLVRHPGLITLIDSPLSPSRENHSLPRLLPGARTCRSIRQAMPGRCTRSVDR